MASKKTKEHHTNMLLIATVEAFLMFFAMFFIYEGYTSVPAVLYMKGIMITLLILFLLLGILLSYLTFKKNKMLTSQTMFMIFCAFLCVVIIYGKNTVNSIRIASAAAIIYFVVDFVCLFLQSRYRK